MIDKELTLLNGEKRVVLESGCIFRDSTDLGRHFGWDTVDNIPIWFDYRLNHVPGKVNEYYNFILPIHLQKDSLIMHYVINDKILYNYCVQKRWTLASCQFFEVLDIAELVKSRFEGMTITFYPYVEGLADNLTLDW